MTNAARKANGLDNSLFEELQSDTTGFEEISRFVKARFGINLPLSEKNLSLVASRLAPAIRGLGVENYKSYLDLIKASPEELLPEFISSLTTNTTEFFREARHYEILKSVAGDMISRKKSRRELRIWCAASSTGQEPYSILMTLLQEFPELESWSLPFLATDIDRDVLARAAEGVYTEAEMKNVGHHLREKYFHKANGPRGSVVYQTKQSLSNRIRFAELNLLATPYPFQHRFDIVFCRNVLIYFDKPTSESVVSRISDSMSAGGYLFLGHSESGVIRPKLLTSTAPAVYVKNEA